MSISFGNKAINAGVKAAQTIEKLEKTEFSLVEKKIELELIVEDLKTQKAYAAAYAGQSDVRGQTASAISVLNQQLKTVTTEVAELQEAADALYDSLGDNVVGLAAIDYVSSEGLERASSMAAMESAIDAMNTSADEVVALRSQISDLRTLASDNKDNRHVRREVAGSISTLNQALKAAEGEYQDSWHVLEAAYVNSYLVTINSDTPAGEVTNLAEKALNEFLKQNQFSVMAKENVQTYAEEANFERSVGREAGAYHTEGAYEAAMKGGEHNVRKYAYHALQSQKQKQNFEGLMSLLTAAE